MFDIACIVSPQVSLNRHQQTFFITHNLYCIRITPWWKKNKQRKKRKTLNGRNSFSWVQHPLRLWSMITFVSTLEISFFLICYFLSRAKSSKPQISRHPSSSTRSDSGTGCQVAGLWVRVSLQHLDPLPHM